LAGGALASSPPGPEGARTAVSGAGIRAPRAELRDDNKQLVAKMRETHDLCDEHGDVASTSLLENWIDEAERRTWFLFEATHVRGAG